MYEPVIKWSGSKRSQAEEILKYFPKEIDTYYEPFCGGASVLRRLLDSDIKVNHYVCSDLNVGLIDLWDEIMNHPDLVSSYYRQLWNELNIDDDKQRKKITFHLSEKDTTKNITLWILCLL
jgi:DNA adenine methylase